MAYVIIKVAPPLLTLLWQFKRCSYIVSQKCEQVKGFLFCSIRLSFALGNQENEYQVAEQQQHRVKKVTYDIESGYFVAHGANGGKGDEDLCTVRQKALRNAGKGI